MATNYPLALDTTTNLPAAGGVGVNLSTFPHSTLHGNVDDAVIAIETELGVDPSGTFATVKSRLDNVLPLAGGALTGNLSTTGTLTAGGSLTAAGATISGTTALTTVTVANTIAVPTPTLFTQATNGQIRGTGSPETVVTASPGMKYIDTAATNGAVEWLKVTGVAATGWKVVYGDTGWRNVTTLINTVGFAATGVHIRRVNEAVNVTFNALRSIDGDPLNEDIYVLPTGFQASATDYSAVNSLGNIFRSQNITNSYWATFVTPTVLRATLVHSSPASSTATFIGGLSFITDQAWPTGALPGT